MIYKVGMLCKHFKGKNLIDKNIYRIEELNVKGNDVDTNKIAYTGEGNMLDSDNLVIYSNIFQKDKYFVREYEDLAEICRKTGFSIEEIKARLIKGGN